MPESDRPNLLFIVTDQQRYDTIARLGNPAIDTPNIDRLVERGVSFTNAYSAVPVCVAARWSIMTGRDAHTTRFFTNVGSPPVDGQPGAMEDRCGPFLPRVMTERGYRTFGIGKFHTTPRTMSLGFDHHQYSNDLYDIPEHRDEDDYAAWLRREHPTFDYVEECMGQRTSMSYVPQTSTLPLDAGVEWWAAECAIAEIRRSRRPFFGYVSFIGPHPPFAPPVPFNRIYDPDRLPDPVSGDPMVDAMDEHLTWMNYFIWAEDIGPSLARNLKAHYYGEISYIDHCIGRILDAIEQRDDADDTLICFVSDHGEHLGDHGAWQKESFFEASTRIPFLLSWPGRLSAGVTCDELVALTDLVGIATAAAGELDARDGIDVLGALEGSSRWRDALVCCYGEPGTPRFKVMVRQDRWKWVFIANGGRQQLFDLAADPDEKTSRVDEEPDVIGRLRDLARRHLGHPGLQAALSGRDIRSFPYEERERVRVRQFDLSRGISDFAGGVEEALGSYRGPS